MKFLKYIINDMNDMAVFIPGAIKAGVMLCILVWILYAAASGIHLIRKKPILYVIYQGILFFLSGVYVYVFLQQAFFSRLPGSRNSVNMVFLGTWGTSLQAQAYVIENIIMFIPFGVLLVLLFKTMRKKGWLCVLLGLFCSVLLEVVQYVTERGHCQLDDVVMNTAGTFIGWLTVRLCLHFLFLSKND